MFYGRIWITCKVIGIGHTLPLTNKLVISFFKVQIFKNPTIFWQLSRIYCLNMRFRRKTIQNLATLVKNFTKILGMNHIGFFNQKVKKIHQIKKC